MCVCVSVHMYVCVCVSVCAGVCILCLQIVAVPELFILISLSGKGKKVRSTQQYLDIKLLYTCYTSSKIYALTFLFSSFIGFDMEATTEYTKSFTFFLFIKDPFPIMNFE